MYGLFEEKDIDKTIQLLESKGYRLIKENRKPSMYNTKNEVLVREYRLSDRIVSFLYLFHEPSDESPSGQNVMIELKLDVDGKEETLMSNAGDYADIESFVNADQSKLNEMLSDVREKRAEAMGGFIQSLK